MLRRAQHEAWWGSSWASGLWCWSCIEFAGFLDEEAADEGFDAEEECIGGIAGFACDECFADELERVAIKDAEGFPAATRIAPERLGRGGIWPGLARVFRVEGFDVDFHVGEYGRMAVGVDRFWFVHGYVGGTAQKHHSSTSSG